MTSEAHHLVTVWNPSYAQDAMDEQVRAGTETHLYLTDGQLWAQRESEPRGETERMARELRDNLLGPDVWSVLEPLPELREPA